MLPSPPQSPLLARILTLSEEEERRPVNAPRLRTVPLPDSDDEFRFLATESATSGNGSEEWSLGLAVSGTSTLPHPILRYRGDYEPALVHSLENPASRALGYWSGQPLEQDILDAPALSNSATTILLYLNIPFSGSHWLHFMSAHPITISQTLELLYWTMRGVIPPQALRRMEHSGVADRVRAFFLDRLRAEFGGATTTSAIQESIRWIDALGRGSRFLGLVQDPDVAALAVREGRTLPEGEVWVVCLG